MTINKKDKNFKNSINDKQINYNFPNHIAIIMDGNGRWAKKRNLPRIAGHKAGVEVLRDIISCCSDIGISYLTLYAFSTENWKRPPEEVGGLMDLLVYYLKKEIDELHKNNIKINVIGDISKLPRTAITQIEKAKEKTKYNSGLIVSIALNYGSRNEIINAVKNICKDAIDGKLKLEDIDSELFNNYLYTKDIPDPDIVIRTSGELRISNFLLWQIAYSELWFTDVYWPDFTSENLLKAIEDYKKRKRRFGGL